MFIQVIFLVVNHYLKGVSVTLTKSRQRLSGVLDAEQHFPVKMAAGTFGPVSRITSTIVE